MWICRIYPADASYHPAGGQEEAATEVLSQLFEDVGDIDEESYSKPVQVEGAPAGHLARWVMVIVDAPEGGLDEAGLARVSRAVGCACRQVLVEDEDE